MVAVNLLIAIMGDTYGRISAKEEIEFYKLRGDLIVELEIFESMSDKSFPKYLPQVGDQVDNSTTVGT